MEINISNIEDLIFFDKEIQKIMPDLKGYFAKWSFAKKNGGLKSIEKENIIHVLNSLETYRDELENYFNKKIKIIKIQNNISKNYEFKINEIEIKDLDDYSDFCISINKNKTFVTLIR